MASVKEIETGMYAPDETISIGQFLVAEGKLRPFRIGRKRLFPRDQVEAFFRREAQS